MKRRGGPLLCGSAFFVAVACATSFPLLLGNFLWPEGLAAGTELLFWPETGIATAGLLVLGWRYWPAILLGVFIPAVLIVHQPLTHLINASGNVAEALVAWWLLTRPGRFHGGFAESRTVGFLLLAAVVAPLFSALPGVWNMVAEEHMPRADFLPALGVWWLANGSAMLLLTPFFIALLKGEWVFMKRRVEAALWLLAGLALGLFAFEAVFRAQGENFAFLVFPFVIYPAIRFGTSETAASLTFVMAAMYVAMVRHSSTHDPAVTMGTLWFLQTFCFVLAATGLAVAALVSERRNAEQRAFDESKRALAGSLLAERARLETLRYQINPHFLFNTLNSLRATLPHAADSSREMVSSIADYFRSMLDRSFRDTEPLRDELNSVRRYLAIEKIRFEDNLRVSFHVDADAEALRVPILILQPLVENAIRHGFRSTPPPYLLEIRVTRALERLVIDVANSGAIHEPHAAARSGVGLENIRERLRLLHGDAARLEITANDGWVRARIELPCVA